MGSPAPVFHHIPKPVTLLEFRDAVLSICRSRFPSAQYARPRRVAVAVSGGVDSMALAFLLTKLVRTFRGICIGDNPAEACFGIVVDHRLRPESADEARAVAHQLHKMGAGSCVQPIPWVRLGIDPPSLTTNLESVARTRRYEALGTACLHKEATSLFFAHHRDDQYETLLMRLLAGHSYRGLQGIRPANAIPECYTSHNVYKSGLLDDQIRPNPYLSFKPPNRVLHVLKRRMRAEQMAFDSFVDTRTPLATTAATAATTADGLSAQIPGHQVRDFAPGVPYLTPLHSEEGGVTIYRPLLEFDKERLIATCEANKIKWFDDPTNLDPSLTARNAIRHLVKTHELPRALQKPAILALGRRSRRRVEAEEAEAHRLLVREAVVRDLDPNTGTLLVQLPTFQDGRRRHRICRLYRRSLRDRIRKPHRRLIASVVVRKLLEFVTPDNNLPTIGNLENVIDKLFPSLAADPTASASDQTRKSFSIAGVLFHPVEDGEEPGSTAQWFLSRAPFPSLKPLPEVFFPGYSSLRTGFSYASLEEQAKRHLTTTPRWREWKAALAWDGRFWIKGRACVWGKFAFLPLMPETLRPFRKALPPWQRARLEQILRYYAPGKVRYTLPALYNVEELGVPLSQLRNEHKQGKIGDGKADEKTRQRVLTLMALPTLGIHLPGLERWVQYETRYKKVDTSLLGLRRRGAEWQGSGYVNACSTSRRRRRRRFRKSRR